MAVKTVVELEIQDNEGWEDVLLVGAPSIGWDLTGKTLTMDFRTARGAADPPAFTLSTTDGSLVIDGPHELRLVVPRADLATTGVAVGTYVSDLLMVDGDGVETVPFGCELRVIDGITQFEETP